MGNYIMTIVKIFKLCICLGYQYYAFFQKIDNVDIRRKVRTIYLFKIRATIKKLNEALEELQISAQKAIDSSTNIITEKEEKDLIEELRRRCLEENGIIIKEKEIKS